MQRTIVSWLIMILLLFGKLAYFSKRHSTPSQSRNVFEKEDMLQNIHGISRDFIISALAKATSFFLERGNKNTNSLMPGMSILIAPYYYLLKGSTN